MNRRPHWTQFLRGQPKRRGVMNKTEAAYARVLESRKLAGEVLWYEYEAITLKLAAGSRYTPDFAVMLADGLLELHEVKGRWTEAARVRIHVAAEKFPFRFLGIQKGGKLEGWKFEEF